MLLLCYHLGWTFLLLPLFSFLLYFFFDSYRFLPECLCVGTTWLYLFLLSCSNRLSNFLCSYTRAMLWTSCYFLLMAIRTVGTSLQVFILYPAIYIKPSAMSVWHTSIETKSAEVLLYLGSSKSLHSPEKLRLVVVVVSVSLPIERVMVLIGASFFFKSSSCFRGYPPCPLGPMCFASLMSTAITST